MDQNIKYPLWWGKTQNSHTLLMKACSAIVNNSFELPSHVHCQTSTAALLGTYLVGMHTYGQQETFLLEKGSSHQRPTLDTTQMCMEGGILVCSHSGIGNQREDSSSMYNNGNGLHQHSAGEKPCLYKNLSHGSAYITVRGGQLKHAVGDELWLFLPGGGGLWRGHAETSEVDLCKTPASRPQSAHFFLCI